MQIPALQTYSTGAGLVLDGVNEYIQTPILPDLSSDNITIIFLGSFNLFNSITYLFTPINNRIVGTFAITINTSQEPTLHRGVLNYVTYNSLTGFNIITNQLTLLVCQYNLGTDTAFFYLYDNTNGKRTSTGIASNPSVMFAGTRTYTLGADSTLMPNRNFNGKIYDFAYYNRLLTNQELDAYWDTLGMYYPKDNLILKYSLNHKQGFTALDESGNGYNGTLINYTGLETSVGASNKWIDELGNPILV